MTARIIGIGLAGTVALACTVATGGAAQAAAKAKCTTGKWVLSSSSAVFTGVDQSGAKITTKLTGGAGTRLTVKNGRVTYDFGKSKKVNLTVTGTVPISMTTQYRKVLKAKVKITGDRKGRFTVDARSATGTATQHQVMTAPLPHDYGTASAVKSFKRGDGNLLIPSGLPYTCTKKALTFSMKAKTTQEGRPGTATTKLSYRRA
ncbi:hypothetical protein GCM10027589_17720 [Actinocorallia lasiicapitis]